MIDSLQELNDVVNNVVNRIVDVSTQKTSTGNWIMGYEDLSDLICETDYYQYFDLIASELATRQEVLDLDTSDHQFDCIFGLSYCPNYEWCEGDEEIFGCDEQQWKQTFRAEPVSHPLSISRMAEIGQQAILHVLETSDIAIEDLTESIGLSMAELQQLNIYGLSDDIPQEPIRFEVFDVQNVRTYPCDTVETALNVYRDLGDSPFKFLAAVIPPGQPYSGRLMLMHQEDGKDVLLNADTETPKLQALHNHFADTVLQDAFRQVAQYVRGQDPISFFVWNDATANHRPACFPTFEAALNRYQALSNPGKNLSYVIYDEQGRGHGGILLQTKLLGGDTVCDINQEALERSPHIALAHAKATLFVHPDNDVALCLRRDAEQKLGLTESDLLVGKWRVRIIPQGAHYGAQNDQLNEGKPLVEFYDTSVDLSRFGPRGQLVTRYYADTLLGRDGWSIGSYPKGLMLDADIPAWTVSGQEMSKVLSYLQERCPNLSPKVAVHPPLEDRIVTAEGKKDPSAPTSNLTDRSDR